MKTELSTDTIEKARKLFDDSAYHSVEIDQAKDFYEQGISALLAEIVQLKIDCQAFQGYCIKKQQQITAAEKRGYELAQTVSPNSKIEIYANYMTYSEAIAARDKNEAEKNL